jgi:hypothetical protein
MPGVAFPPVGRLGYPSPPAPVLCAAQTAILPVSGHCTRPRAPRPCLLLFVRGVPSGLGVGAKPPPPGLLVARFPMPGIWPGDRWRSHVPAFPPGLPAPLLAPGGRLATRHVAPRTAACRPLDTVGCPLHPALRDIRLSTPVRISGLPHAACLLAPASSVRPLLGGHVECTTDLPARL